MAALLKSLFFLFNVSFLPKYRQSGSTPIFRPVTFLTLFWRRFGGAAWWRACASLRTSRESVDAGRVKTINDVLVSRSRRADDVPGITREWRRECLYVTIGLLCL